MKIRVAVMFGGKSVEHEVSVISGLQALEHLDTEKYEAIPIYIARDNRMYTGEAVADIQSYRDIDALLDSSQRVLLANLEDGVGLLAMPGGEPLGLVDVVLPVVHGTNEEDGTLQGYLKTVGVPFAECDVAASALGMDKAFQKLVLKDAGVPVLDCLVLQRNDYADIDDAMERCRSQIGFPLIVKPACLGSSVGIGLANDDDELEGCLDDAFAYADKVVVERAISNLREINCSVLGDAEGARASVCEEPMHTEGFLTYEDKYGGGGKAGSAKGAPGQAPSEGMASLSRVIPAQIDEQTTLQIQDLSVRAFKALGCSGVVRIDYLLDGDTGEVFLNELNTIPGSLAFYLWEASGLGYPELLDELVQIALRRFRNEEALSFSFETHILDGRNAAGSKKV